MPCLTPWLIVSCLRHHNLRLVAIFNTHGHIDGRCSGSLVHDDEAPPGDNGIEVRIHDADKHMLLDPLGTSGMLGRSIEGLSLPPPEKLGHG